MDPSPIPKFDNPKAGNGRDPTLWRGARTAHLYAIPPHTKGSASISMIYPFQPTKADQPCGLCGPTRQLFSTS